MIEIKQLNKRLLLEYIHSVDFSSSADIPITIHRALSQTKNPRIDEEDVILLLAYHEGKLVGYLGILPDTIFLKKNQPIKIGWLSCLWVSQLARGKGISLKLISKSLELWGNNILSADYVPSTKKIYDKINQFTDKPYSKKGIRLYIKSDLYNILPQKKTIFTKLKWLFKAIDFSANGLLSIRLIFYKEDVSHLLFEYINHIDEEANDFIVKQQEKQLFKRKADDLNWIIHNPWILSSNEKDVLNKKYYFSSTAKSFNFYTLKVRNTDNTLIAVLIFSKRDNTLKLPYLYHDNCLDTIIKVLNYHLIKWRIKTFTTYHSALAQSLMNKKTPTLYKKEIYRNYMVSSTFNDEIFNSEIEIQDGDGDCCFT
jgi:GNAT superfamily N-acetyltransferase